MTRTDGAQLFGPVISTRDPEAHIRLFGEGFGMHVDIRLSLDGDQTHALLGVHADAAELIVMTTPGVWSGVVILALAPAHDETVRDPARPTDRDAVKVIDFHAPNFDTACDHLKSLGFDLAGEIAEYELPPGRFREAHVWGPDNVVVALLGGPEEFFADFAQVVHTTTSEVQSVSAPVGDLAATVAFYADVLGLANVYEYEIDDPSLAGLVGTSSLHLQAVNVGRSTREPYVGLIDYGAAMQTGDSLATRNRLPRRGTVGLMFGVPHLDNVAATAARHGHLTVPPVNGWPTSQPGETTMVSRVIAPHGVEHFLVPAPEHIMT